MVSPDNKIKNTNIGATGSSEGRTRPTESRSGAGFKKALDNAGNKPVDPRLAGKTSSRPADPRLANKTSSRPADPQSNTGFKNVLDKTGNKPVDPRLLGKTSTAAAAPRSDVGFKKALDKASSQTTDSPSSNKTPSKTSSGSAGAGANVGVKKNLDTKKGVDGEKENFDEEEPVATNTSIFEMLSQQQLSGKGGQEERQNPQGQGTPLGKVSSPLHAFKEMQGAPGEFSKLVLPQDKEALTSLKQKAQASGDVAAARQSAPNYVAPLAVDTSGAIAPEQKAQASLAPHLQNLIDQIVNTVYTLKAGNQTDTVITLKNPPILAGASLVVSSFDNARGEFNIAFHNLNNAAQQLLANQTNQLGLRQGLEEKGYFVHIVVVTTNPLESPALSSGVDQQQTGRDSQDHEDGRQQKEKEKEEE